MTPEERIVQEPDIESLFQLGSGRIQKVLEQVRLAHGGQLHVGRAVALSAAISWFPLLVLATVEGVAWGHGVAVPLVKDFLTYGQFLLAVPILILGEVIVGERLVLAVSELRRSDILTPEDTPTLDGILKRVVDLWEGRWVNSVLLLLTFGVTFWSLWSEPKWLTGDWQLVGKRISLPGWWYLLISMPLLRFLLLRWLWRVLMWSWVLFRLSRLRLKPLPVHPDRAGGLAFIGGTQVGFGIVMSAFSVQLSCLVADAVQYHGANLVAYKSHLIAFVLIAVLFLVLPLLVFVPTLARAREEGLLFLSGSGHQGAEDLEKKLSSDRVGPLPAETISGLADFSVLYENARLMRLVPIEWKHILALALAAGLPFLPLVFLVVPAQEVLWKLVELLK